MKFAFLLATALAFQLPSAADSIPSSGTCLGNDELEPVIYPDDWEEVQRAQLLSHEAYLWEFFETFEFSEEDLALEETVENGRKLDAKLIPPRVNSMGIPEYPHAALESGLKGYCETIFIVSAAGIPTNVTAYCSNSVFIEPAKEFAKTIRFVPGSFGDQPIPTPNVVQPIRFCAP